MRAESPAERRAAYRAQGARRTLRHFVLGLRWLKCGRRLFARNPWLLGGMGLVATTLISVLERIPFMGGILVACIAPVLLANAYLAIDAVSQQKMALPSSLWLAALKRSPTELARIFHDEERLLPTVVAAIYCLAVALGVNLLAQLVTGAAWTVPWARLDPASLLGVLAMELLALLGYAMLAASLIYALPLAFLQGQPLIPAMPRSLQTTVRTPAAHLPVLVLVLAPYLLGALAARLSPALAVLIQILASAVALPLAACSLYCAYRTLFPWPHEIPPSSPPVARGPN